MIANVLLDVLHRPVSSCGLESAFSTARFVNGVYRDLDRDSLATCVALKHNKFLWSKSGYAIPPEQLRLPQRNALKRAETSGDAGEPEAGASAAAPSKRVRST